MFLFKVISACPLFDPIYVRLATLSYFTALALEVLSVQSEREAGLEVIRVTERFR